MNPESKLVVKIMKALRQRGGWWFKVHGGATQITGIPDILGCYEGRFVAIEVKLPLPGRVKASPRQNLMLARIARNGGAACIATSVEDALRELDYVDALIALGR